jgi:hypothetical protein
VGEVRLELCCVGLAMDLECKARSSFRAEGKASAQAVSRGQARASIALLEFGEGAAANPHRERWWVTYLKPPCDNDRDTTPSSHFLPPRHFHYSHLSHSTSSVRLF